MPDDAEILRLPLPERLQPVNIKRSLMTNVRGYFYKLYNSSPTTFKSMLGSVGNGDAVTGNRMFDRHIAVGLIKTAAKDAHDSLVFDAMDGDVYKCLVHAMRAHPDLRLKLRRQQYDQLAHQQQAAD